MQYLKQPPHIGAHFKHPDLGPAPVASLGAGEWGSREQWLVAAQRVRVTWSNLQFTCHP